MGAAGDDRLKGGSGDDILSGGAGDDRLDGGRGDDELSGDAGDDVIDGGSGADVMDGGAGDDIITADGGRAYGGHHHHHRHGRDDDDDDGDDDGGEGGGRWSRGPDDVADGGSDSDIVHVGHGDDRGIYTLSENLDASDLYYGGHGYDTLQINLTYGEALEQAIQDDLQGFRDHLAAQAEPPRGRHHRHDDDDDDDDDGGERGRGRDRDRDDDDDDGGEHGHHGHHDHGYQFTAFDLRAQDWEALEVNLVNTGPDADDDTATTGENAAVAINVLGNDSDVDRLDVLTVDSASVTAGGGSASVVGNQVVYDPGTAYDYLAVGEEAEVTLSYTISDLAGATDTATVTITITGENDGPSVSGAVAATQTEDDAPFVVDLLAGASDPDTSDVLNVSGLTLDSGDASGITVSVDGNSVNVDPSAYNHLAVGESEVVTYSYLVDDGNGGTVPQTATITIEGRNDGPSVSGAIAATQTEDDAPFVVDLLAGASDPDTSDVLNVSGLTLDSGVASGITVSVDGNSVNVDPSAYNHLAVGESEVVTYSYLVDDGNGGTVPQTATITIEGRNDAPEAADDTASVNEDSAITIDVLFNDGDVDGDSLTIVGASEPANGSIALVAGEFVYTPDADFFGTDSFTYTIADGNGGFDTATVDVTVNAVNDAPDVTFAAPAPVNLVSNGSFESGSAGFHTGGSTGITDWTVTGHSVDYGALWEAVDGSRSIDLNGSAPGGVEQTIETVAGATYQVTFGLAGNRHDAPDEKLMHVEVDGVNAGGFSFTTTGGGGSSMSWSTQTFTFTADDDSTTLGFISDEAGFLPGDIRDGAALDNVVVTRIGADFFVDEDTPLAITGLSVSDIDAGANDVEVTLAAGNGNVTVSSTVAGGLGAAGISGNGTGTVVLTGSLAAINATLAAAGGVTYQGDTDYFGADSLSVTIDDLGNTGGGSLTDVETISIIVDPVDDGAAPAFYAGELGQNTTEAGQVPSSGGSSSPSASDSDYWLFEADAGGVVTIDVDRVEGSLDPALWIFEGVVDPADLGPSIDGSDPGFIAFADDNDPAAVPGPFADPSFTFTASSSGVFTAIVTDFASGSDGGDGVYDYTIEYIYEPPVPADYAGLLGANSTEAGQVSSSGGSSSPSFDDSDYWLFSAEAGDIVTIDVDRVEGALDPALWIFEGIVDPADLGPSIDSGDPGFIGFADDNDPAAVSGPFADPSFSFTASSSGVFTAIVTDFASGSDGGDGVYDYTIEYLLA